MLTAPDFALAAYEFRRAAANDDRAVDMIRADVTLNMGGIEYHFPAIGFSSKAIAESAEELAGGEPFGLTVIEVTQCQKQPRH
jgi:hypothetical protein